MIELLKNHYNYTQPILKPWKSGDTELVENDKGFCLFKNGHRWMTYHKINHCQAYELFSHYSLAKGHCICTGLGLGVRENWILRKKDVTKVTIIEKNEKVLEYHKYINSPLLKECEIIIGDASEILGKCDTLLIDHYEQESLDYMIQDIHKVLNNITCETVWFWSLDGVIIKYRQDILNRKKDNFTYVSSDDYSYFDAYNDIKNITKIDKLPDLDEDTLNLFCFFYSSQFFFDNDMPIIKLY